MKATWNSWLLASETSIKTAAAAIRDPKSVRTTDHAPAIPQGYEHLDFLVSLLCSQIDLHTRLVSLSVNAAIAELDRRRSR